MDFEDFCTMAFLIVFDNHFRLFPPYFIGERLTFSEIWRLPPDFSTERWSFVYKYGFSTQISFRDCNYFGFSFFVIFMQEVWIPSLHYCYSGLPFGCGYNFFERSEGDL